MLKLDVQTRLTLTKLEALKKAARHNALWHLRKIRAGKNNYKGYYLWVQTARGYGYQIHTLLNKQANENNLSKEAC